MIRDANPSDFGKITPMLDEIRLLQKHGINSAALSKVMKNGHFWTQEVGGKVYAVFGIIFLQSHCEVFILRDAEYKKYAIGLAKACKRLLVKYEDHFILSIIENTPELIDWSLFLGFKFSQQKDDRLLYIYGGA